MAKYMASTWGAVALIVIDVLTLLRGIPSKRISMSFKELTGTPAFPTSPSAKGWSESYPTWVGKSKATLKPVCPCSRRYLYRSLDSSAVPNPAYCLIVHSRPL